MLGILAGLAVTLVGLSHLGPPPGCEDTAAGRAPTIFCPAVAEGFPLRWLAADHRALVVTWSAMLKDLVEYTVISTAALYGGWLGPRTRERPALTRVPAAAIVASVLAGLTLSAATGGFPLTWVTADQGAPVYNLSALLTDTAVWTLVALGGCAAVRALTPSAGGRRRAVEPVRPAGDGA